MEKHSSSSTVGDNPAMPNFRMYLGISTAMAGAIMFGLDQGNFGNVQTFESFRQEWCVGRYGNDETCSEEGATTNTHWQNNFILWGASLITIGAAIGGLLLGPILTHRLGRRPCICAGSFICFAGCMLVSFLSFRRESIFMVGRFITGFGVGVCCFALPLYNAEVATQSIRGATGSLFQFNVVVGSFIATLVTLFWQDWRMGMLLPGIAGAAVGLAIWLTPESPRYVMSKRGFEAGKVALQKVRRGDVSAEAQEIQEELATESGVQQLSYLQLFTLPGVRRRVLIACWMQVAQQLTGVNAFLGYASTLFKDVGMENPYVFNVTWNAVMIIGCVLGLLLVDSPFGGRRTQLLGATWLMSPPLILAGFAVAYNWPGVISMICVCIYGAGFQIAWGIIPWIYPAEIFLMAEKERAVSLAVFCEFLTNGVIVVITPLLMSFSIPGTLFIFGGLNFVNLMFVFGFVKETKGVPLADVPSLFESKRAKKARDLQPQPQLECEA